MDEVHKNMSNDTQISHKCQSNFQDPGNAVILNYPISEEERDGRRSSPID